jgi:hypothetical protein
MDSPPRQAVEHPFNLLTRLIARKSFLDEVACSHVSVGGLVFYIILFYYTHTIVKISYRLLVKTGCIRNHITYLPIHGSCSFHNSPEWARASSLSRLHDHTQTHSDTPHSVGILWTSDQPDAETLPDNTQHSQETDIHASGGIRTRIPNKPAAADPRLGRRDHRNRRLYTMHC